MEIWDIYNANREKTGRTHIRGNEMKDGDFHLVVHVWILNKQGQLLIQQRQPWKKGWANMWDCAAAGSAIQDETSEMAAIREVKEELGIDLDIEKAEILSTIKFSRGFDDIWLVHQTVDVQDLRLQYDEVANAKWATIDEIRQLVEQGDFIAYAPLEYLFDLILSNISLKKAILEDSEELYELQKEVFMPLYEKYEDHDTTPVNQSLNRFQQRIGIGDFYKILMENTLVGSVHVYPQSPSVMRLQMVNILAEFQNKGIAQQVMKRLESIYPQAESWELSTILEEERNCYVYEKMGYVRTEDRIKINDKMTIVRYVKETELNHLMSL